MRITSDQRGLSGGLTALLCLASVCISAFLFASTFRGPALPTTSSESGDEAIEPEQPPPHLIYSQYDNPATQPPLGIGSQLFEPASQALSNQAADDFSIGCCSEGFLIETVKVMGEYSAGGGPASSFNVYFYRDAAGNVPGQLIFSATNRPYVGTPPDFSIDVGNVFVDTQRYWVSVQAVMDSSTNGQWFWHNRTSQLFSGAVWQNPGDGYGTGCLVWNRKNTCLPEQVWPDQVFSLYGVGIPTPTATATASATSTASPTPTATASATATPPDIVVTNTNDSGPGSLRQALADAQDGDIIGFNSSLNGQVIGLTGSQLVINKNITIRGPGLNLLTVSRTSGMFRNFIVTPGHSVAINGLTIRGGRDDGGGIYNDHSTVTLNHCSVRENFAGDFNSGGGRGAGIYNNGFQGSASMTIVNSAVNDNRADRAGGGIYNDGNNGLVNVSIINSTVDHNTASFIGGVVGDGDGGGIYNGGQVNVMISSSSVSTNSSGAIGTVGVPGGSGGGIYGGTLTISNSIINSNSAQYQSGGIHGAYVTITNSTVNNNQVRGFKGAAGPGGGMWINGGTITNSVVSGNFAGSGGGISGSATIVNSTISNNVAIQDGGGIAGESVITNCTISHNSANRGGGIYRGGTIAHSTISDNSATQGGGIYVVSNSMLEISDTILKSGSTGSNLVNGGGAISSHGYNLSNDNGGGFLTGPGDQINIDPLLGPLQNNGGQTFTHALLNGSPAIDAGNPGFTPPPFTDQRGYLRVYNGRIDIGSFELQPNITPTPSPTPLPATHFEIDAPPIVLGGIAFSISVTAKDKFNNTATSYSGIVHFTSSDASANLPPDSFLVNGIGTFMPALISSGLQTITATDTADPSITGTTDPIFVKPGPTPTASPTPTSTPFTPTPTPSPTPSPTASCAARDLPDCYDFMVDVTDSPDPIQVGDQLTYSIVVSVYGTLYPPSIQMTDTLPAGVELISVTTNDGGCSGTSTITCGLTFQWPYGDQALVTLVVRPTVAGTINNTVNIDVGDKDPSNNTDTVTTTVIPGPSPTPTPTPSTRLLNISTRMEVKNGDEMAIAGFIITPNDTRQGPSKGGSNSGRTFIKGLGPSLGNFGIPDFLPDPTLELRNSSGLIYYNNNWRDDPLQVIQIKAGGDPHLNDLESAIIWTLDPGPYTVVLAGRDGRTGTGLVEVYDVGGQFSNSQLANISTRGFVGTDENVMIGGFILGNSVNNAQIVIRGVGPSLTNFGVPNALADPTLELRDNNGALIVANDNWQDDPASAAQLIAHGLTPQNPLESGIFLELQPNLYTAILAGKNGGVGVGLVEIYNLH